MLLLLACIADSKLDPGPGPVAGQDTARESASEPADDSGAGIGDSATPDDSDPDAGLDDSDPTALGCEDAPTPEGAFVPQGSSTAVTLADCVGITLVSAGAVNQTLTLSLDAWAGPPPILSVTDPAGHPVAAARALDTSASIQLWQSGEIYLAIQPATDEPASGTLSITCAGSCDREYTRYPIVLMHGMGGAGIFNGIDYFFDVRDLLEAQGYLVRNPSTEPFATTEERAAVWADVLQELADEGLGRRFILIGHSQGGLDARYLASALGWGDRIVAIDMIGTPNRGTVVADVLSGTITDGLVSAEVVDLGTAAFASIFGLGSDEQSLSEAMAALTTEGVAALNAAAPDDARVYYRSWAGHSCGTLELDCQDDHGGEVVEPLLELLYIIPWLYGLPNDGLVPTDSVPWGDYQGEIDTDHLDEIGQFADADNPAFDHLDFYLDEVRTLAAMGF